jgi:hypothetical protein
MPISNAEKCMLLFKKVTIFSIEQDYFFYKVLISDRIIVCKLIWKF